MTVDRLRGTRRTEPFRGAPDFAVEILSPSDLMGDALAKVRRYLEHGVRLVWLIAPQTRSILAWTTWGNARQYADGDTIDGADVLPGFSAPVRDLLPPRHADG
ncbi:MAG: Uma2 family endonuclease [Dehalococcoidia bacterium]